MAARFPRPDRATFTAASRSAGPGGYDRRRRNEGSDACPEPGGTRGDPRAGVLRHETSSCDCSESRLLLVPRAATSRVRRLVPRRRPVGEVIGRTAVGCRPGRQPRSRWRSRDGTGADPVCRGRSGDRLAGHGGVSQGVQGGEVHDRHRHRPGRSPGDRTGAPGIAGHRLASSGVASVSTASTTWGFSSSCPPGRATCMRLGTRPPPRPDRRWQREAPDAVPRTQDADRRHETPRASA